MRAKGLTQPSRCAIRKRVLIVDDHPIFRQGLVRLIENAPDLAVCGEAASTAEAMQLVGQRTPDVAIVDLSLIDGDGLDLVQSLRGRFPKLAMLVLSLHDESLYAEAALRAGALGYVMKHEPIEKVLHAIRCVLKGEVFLSERMAARMLRRVVGHEAANLTTPAELLSNRELQVFRMLGEGKGVDEIAHHLKLSRSTVDSHRTNMRVKLRLNSNAELLQQAIQWSRQDTSAAANGTPSGKH